MKESKSHGYKTKDMVQQQEMVQQRPVLTKASPLTEEQARALKSLYELLVQMKVEREREDFLHKLKISSAGDPYPFVSSARGGRKRLK